MSLSHLAKKDTFFFGSWILVNLLLANGLLALVLPANWIQTLIGMWAPALSAMVWMKLRSDSRIILRFRLTGIRWFGWAALFVFSVGLLTSLIGLGSNQLSKNPDFHVNVVGAILTAIIWIFFSLGEEIGWRGFLQTGLRDSKYAPVVIGLVWAIWHIADQVAAYGWLHSFFIFTPLVLLVSYFLSWLAYKSNSILPCAFFHGLWNFLNLRILNGNPKQGISGLFLSTDYSKTQMEGLHGLIAGTIVALPFIYFWHRERRTH